MSESVVLADVNKVVGVAIALVGTVVVAPDGTRLLLGSYANWFRRRRRSVRDLLAKALPILRRTVAEPRIIRAEATASLGALTGHATGRVWSPSAPVEQQIEALRQYVSDVQAQVSRLREDVRRESAAWHEALGEAERRLSQRIDDLRRELARMERNTAAIDARGLPVIGLGILLGTIPEELASVPWHLGWLLPALGLTTACLAVANLVRARRPNIDLDPHPVTEAA